MIALVEPDDRRLGSPLGRTSPVVKLAVALAWLVGLALTTAPGPALVLAATALVAGLAAGGVRPRELLIAMAPLLVAAAAIGVTNVLFGAANLDADAAEVARVGPLRLTATAVEAGAGLAARVVAIGAVGAVFGLTTDPTRLVDALVQQARLPDRFAYGALAAYGAIPHFATDLATLREARRIRGLPGSRHPRLLVGLLVLALRRADRMALAMDARAFGSGPRSRFREVRWSRVDAVVAVSGAVALAAAAVVALAVGPAA